MNENDKYRTGIGAIITNEKNELLIFQRRKRNNWQPPQGGINQGEDFIEALFREIYEETGIKKEKLVILSETKDFIKYEIPEDFRSKRYLENNWIGQRKKWYLLRFSGCEKDINLNIENPPEFCDFKWSNKDYLLNNALKFKQDMYKKVLLELGF